VKPPSNVWNRSSSSNYSPRLGIHGTCPPSARELQPPSTRRRPTSCVASCPAQPSSVSTPASPPLFISLLHSHTQGRFPDSQIPTYQTHPNFNPLLGSHRPSCAGPLFGRALPDVVGTPNRIPTSGVHIPAAGMFALVGVGAVRGASACASAPYCGFCASACFCCCSDVDAAWWRLSELMRVARSLSTLAQPQHSNMNTYLSI
jgi:hypothetical protein